MLTDPRIERTHAKLHQAIAELMLANKYNDITIRDIVAHAHIGYATFFRHFADKDALLLDLLNDLLGELRALLQPATADWAAEGQLIFEHVAANAPLYRVLVQGEGTQTILAQIQAAGTLDLHPRLVGATAGPVPVDILANHIVASIMALIKWWLEEEMPYTAAQMGQIYAALIFQPFMGHNNKKKDEAET